MNRFARLYDKKWFRALGPTVVLAYIIFQAVDLTEDYRHGTSLVLLVVEGASTIAGVMLLYYFMRLLSHFNAESSRLESRMQQLERENLDWKNRTFSYVQGLNVAIHQQLTAWDLSPAEKEI